jgi:hypothetical protein
MLVTGYPPRVDGTVIDPDVDEGIAGSNDIPLPMLALPSDTIYSHVIPLTVSVSAFIQNAVNEITVTKMPFINFCFIMWFSAKKANPYY